MFKSTPFVNELLINILASQIMQACYRREVAGLYFCLFFLVVDAL